VHSKHPRSMLVNSCCCYSTYNAKKMCMKNIVVTVHIKQKKVCMKNISIFGEQNNYSVQYKELLLLEVY